MKNFKMNFQQLGSVEVLTRSQLKNVLGGLAPASDKCCYSYTANDGSVVVGVINNSTQSGCQAKADSIIDDKVGTNAHYDFHCDGV